MNVLLNPPRSVVCVGQQPVSTKERLSPLPESAVDEVVHRESAAAVEALLSDRRDIGCLVVGPTMDRAETVQLCEAVRSTDDTLPIVVLASEGDASFTNAVTLAGADTCLFSPDDDTLQTVVGRAVDDYVASRQATEESSILDAMLTQLAVPLYAKDTEGRHLKLSDLREAPDPDEALGKTDIELYSDETPELAKDAYEDDMSVVESESRVFRREESYAPDGDEYWSRTTKAPWYGEDGRLKGLVGISQNSTELKEKEKRLREVRERFDQFADHLSHDLQNPLQVASGYLDIARETGEETALEKIEAALERMEEMIDDMSTVASHRGLDGTDSTTFYLADFLESTWEPLSTGDVELELAIPDEYLVHAEKVELRPLFENLLQNAVEHDPTAPLARTRKDDDGDLGEDGVTVTVGLTPEGGVYVTDGDGGTPDSDRSIVLDSTDAETPDWASAGLGIIDDIAARNDWFVSITESEDGIRFEVDNCLGVCEQSAPEPRVDQDLTDIGTVGTLEKAGYVEHDPVSSEWVVAGDGADIRGQDNDFKFVYTTVERPVRIEGRVVDIDHVADYSKSGFMIRDSLDEDATYAYAGATPRRGTELLWRTHRGTDGMSQTLEVDPFAVDWYRVDRVGGRLTAWLSTDGQTWEPVDERRIEIDGPVYVGLAVSSIVPGALAEATFRHVTVSTLDV